jgi:hypothetical protein
MSPHPREEVPASPRGTPRWIALAWAAVLAVVAWHHIPKAHANHTHTGSNQLHIATIHGNNGTSTTPGDQDEQFCVQSRTASIDGTRMATFIDETLTKLSTIWDGTASWRVDLWRTAKSCVDYDSATRATIEYEYHIKDDWYEVSLCGGYYSCVVFDNAVYDGSHTHYKWGYSYLQTEHVNGYDTRARKFINHETGHILGLKDPDYNGHCMNSVMHNDLYSSMGCTDPVWYPTSSDKSSVTRIADRTNTW